MALKDYKAQRGRHGYIVLPVRTGNTAGYIILRDCPFCEYESRVFVPAQGLWDWEHGTLVREAMPTLTPAERERVMTGIHGDCWTRAFEQRPDDN